MKMESGSCSLVLAEIRSKLEKLLSEHSNNEKMTQEIEEALALTKQPKVITAEEQMVSAWNKYIGLKMETDLIVNTLPIKHKKTYFFKIFKTKKGAEKPLFCAVFAVQNKKT